MKQLTETEINQTSGGIAPFFLYLGYAVTYGSAIDMAMDFGAGFGAGLYDAIHS